MPIVCFCDRCGESPVYDHEAMPDSEPDYPCVCGAWEWRIEEVDEDEVEDGTVRCPHCGEALDL